MLKGVTCPNCGFSTSAGLITCPSCKNPLTVPAPTPPANAPYFSSTYEGQNIKLLGWILMGIGLFAGTAFFLSSSGLSASSTAVNEGVMNGKTNGCIGSSAVLILGGLVWMTGRLVEAISKR